MSESTQISLTKSFNQLQPLVQDRVCKVYKSAFAGDPWFETSQCAATKSNPERCEGGFSRLAVGEFCRRCESVITTEAYPTEELLARFDRLSETRNSLFYIENDPNGEIKLVSISWLTNPRELFELKYTDVSEMCEWLLSTLPQEFVYLNELFADTQKFPKGNLANYGDMIRSIAKKFETKTICFRTKNERLINKTIKEFHESSLFYPQSESPEKKVPDRRFFVIIKL